MTERTTLIKLTGGLGNQMFQYAFGRRYSLANNTVLEFDKSWFRTKERAYGLQYFNIEPKIATPAEIFKLKDFQPIPRIPRLKITRDTHIHERTLDFDHQIFNMISDKSIYFDGYWQNENYFKDIEDTIRKDFAFRHDMSSLNTGLAQRISNANAVAIHIRRGDYVSNSTINEKHGTCSQQYYRDAIEYLNKILFNPEFYIFADDLVWADENIKPSSSAILVTHNGEQPQEDLRLMSLCKHFIIANSSFSWWGAWLSENKKKTVIAPKRWFREEKIADEYKLPVTWIRM